MMCHTTPPPPRREPNLAPLHHTVIIGAESLGEFFPRQAGKLPEPLAEIFREELRLRVLYLLTCFHSPTSHSASSLDYVRGPEWTVDGTVFEMWLGLPPRPERSVRVFSGGPILTIDRTVFEMWLGSL